MKINKLFLMAGLALLGFAATSCSDDDDYTPGAASGKYNITFPDQENYALELDATEFSVTIQRENGNGQLTVPLNVSSSDELSVPSSVTFADGETVKEIPVQISPESKAFVDYYLTISVPAEYEQPYRDDNDAPSRLQITVHKEDYVHYGSGFYYSWFADEELPATVDYSEFLDVYRFNDVFVEGYNLYFRISEEGKTTVCDETGASVGDANFPLGFTYGNYGMVYLRWLDKNYEDYNYYDERYGIYVIPVQYRVAAGSFGTDLDYYGLEKD